MEGKVSIEGARGMGERRGRERERGGRERREGGRESGCVREKEREREREREMREGYTSRIRRCQNFKYFFSSFLTE